MGNIFFYISVFILPLFPALGIVGLLGIIIASLRLHLSQVIYNKINWGWGILAVWLVINSYFAHQPQEAWLGLANFLPFFVLFIAISPLLDSIDKLTGLAWCLVLPSLPIVILGLGQLWLNWSSFPLVKTILGWELVPQGIPPGRMSSLFIYANFLAIYLLITLILSLGLWLNIWYKKSSNQWQLIILTIIIFADSLGLALTSSRSAWGIALIAFMAFALYLGWNWLVYGVIGLAMTVFWASFAPKLGQEWIRTIVPKFIWSRLSDQMYPNRPIETLRITQWQFCWARIQEKPLIGWGLRNFTPLYEAKTNFWLGHPHSLFLMLGMEIGIVATIFLCLIVGKVLLDSMYYGLALKSTRYSDLVTLPFPERIIILAYILAFSSCVLFNLFDVTIFDLRVNIITWTLLAALNGITTKKKASSYDLLLG